MLRAYNLYTGKDGNSHVQKGSIDLKQEIAAESLQFKEDPPHSSSGFHNDPVPQFVIFLAGAVEFTTRTGERFTVNPGEVLLAVDHTGSGHSWKLVNDGPWKRAYIVFTKSADLHFVPDPGETAV